MTNSLRNTEFLTLKQGTKFLPLRTSAKDNVNVELAFRELIQAVLMKSDKFLTAKEKKQKEKGFEIFTSHQFHTELQKQKKIEERAVAFERVKPKPIPMHFIPSVVLSSSFVDDIRFHFFSKIDYVVITYLISLTSVILHSL